MTLRRCPREPGSASLSRPADLRLAGPTLTPPTPAGLTPAGPTPAGVAHAGGRTPRGAAGQARRAPRAGWAGWATLAAGLTGAALLATAARAEGHGPHWTYTGTHGAAHWAELDEGFKTCKLGRHQSPIDIRARQVKAAPTAQPIGFGYAAGAAQVINNGHTVQVNLAEGGAIELGGERFKLLQFHFHTPSEERIDGRAYPLVAHLVHKSEAGQLAVVAVLFRQGPENPVLRQVFAAMPAQAGAQAALDGTLDAGALLPPDRAYYGFTGSLTTPPCSEEVRWHVLRTPVSLSAAQLAAFRRLYPMNARPVQPLNGRVVTLAR